MTESELHTEATPGTAPGSWNSSARPPYITHDAEYLKYIVLVVYPLTFIVGVVGNSLVIYILFKFPSIRKKSVANYYILNLAFADVLFMFSIPFFCYSSFTNDWIFGNPMCKISYVIREINRYASVFTLTALSLDRFLASFHTLGHLRTLRVGKVVCTVTWAASAALCWPYWLYARSLPINGHPRYNCRIAWPVEVHLAQRRLWTALQLSLGLLLPIIVIVTSYTALVWRLKVVMKPRDMRRVRSPNRRMTRTIFAVVLIFILCQTPYYIMEEVSLIKIRRAELLRRLQQRYVPRSVELALFVNFNALAQVLTFVSSCCNPIVYGICNENFRKLYMMILCGKQRDRLSSSRKASVQRRSTKSRSQEEAARAAGVQVVVEAASSSGRGREEALPLREGGLDVPGGGLHHSDSGFSLSSLHTFMTKSGVTSSEHHDGDGVTVSQV